MAVPLMILLAVFWVDWVVGVILLATSPWVPVFMMLVGWGAEAAGRRQLQAMARMGAHFADRLKGLGLLRVYGRGEAELAGVARAAEGVQQGAMRVLRIAFLSSTVLEFFASVSVALVAVYFGLSHLGLLALRSTVPSLGAAMLCLLLAPEFYAPFRRLAAHYHDRANALAAAAEVERVLGELPQAVDEGEFDDAVSGCAVDEMNGNSPILALVNVTLRPQGAAHDVLHGGSLSIARGEWVALIGPSGSGKSTLLEAAAGWLAPREGSRQLAPGARVVYAGQRPYLFHGSIADNLRLAKPQASDDELLAAAEAAQVQRFARHLPDGLDTLIGERGLGLSGGEARRIGLARALLQAPDLLLLDEPTAFLDPQTEADLLRALARFAQGRSVLMATHSPAAMRWAHRVVALDDLAGQGDAPAIAERRAA
jgi:ATP-binding cassette subfamily C protein CydD